MVTDGSGIRYFEFNPGVGQTPRWGQLLTIKYVSYVVLDDGSLEEVSNALDSPFLLKHGNGQTIKGLELALHSMRPGARRRVEISQEELGFNVGGLGPLPATQQARKRFEKLVNDCEKRGRAVNLVYDVELVLVQDDITDRGYYTDIPVSVADQEAKVGTDELSKRQAAE